MKHVVGRLVALVALAIVIGIGAITVHSASADEVAVDRITDYRADFTVSADGELRAIETLTVDFPGYKHGIFRFFDTRDGSSADNRLIPKDIEVTRDGVAEPFEVLSESRGRYRNIKIGSASTTINGKHVYRVSYRIDEALSQGPDGTEFYWDLIPSGWVLPIDRSRLAVHLPAPAQDLRCALGVGRTSGCTAEGEGTEELTVVTGALSPNTPVTIKAVLDLAAPQGNELFWPSWLDPVLGRNPFLLGVVLLFAVLLAGAGAMLSRSVHEKAPPLPLMYAPPEGVGPAQAAYVLTEKIDDKAFVATMMYAAEKHAVTLNQDGKTWTIAGASDPEAWKKVDEVTLQAGQTLGVLNGATFAASPKSVEAGQKLKSALSSFRSDTRGWARISGFMEPSGLGGGGVIVLLVCAGLAIWLGAFNPFDMSILAVIPGLFGIAALSVGASGAGTRRTASGRELWSRVGGFRRILSTPSAQDRFDFSGRKELYTAYLPWAVAFDCADEWAKKYRIETGEEPPAPSYFTGYNGVHTGLFVGQMVSSFDSAVSSAISAYEATQSSSSSGGGGGGFSGGGGGGGGGGGSW